ncbi:hypothetical protein SCHPADRAFT_946343 [Schizopora paradoxa]|uniref:Aldos-2-ulose dehydratase beta-propeller domain-containing protein n=1 Tax=Schizopora paradoxa TaxID=27342 RepID=A0A0H2R309_9AGAM|nr:hypothetical protein SCHPADRAFT_946343 [Schizopora paradoxa]
MQQFLKQTIESGRTDGYWIEAFPFKADNKVEAPDLIGYGLGTKDLNSKIKLFSNPYGHSGGNRQDLINTWKSEVITELEFPVAMRAHEIFSYADITSNGFNDLVICDQYGPSMNDLWADGGRVLWFENPGVRGDGKWTEHYIGKSAGMHRLKTGRFIWRSLGCFNHSTT